MLIRPPLLVRRYYNQFTWRMPADEKKIYLTFDDGPVKGPTEFVLETLRAYDAKATFFCIGKNVKKDPEIFEMIDKAGHKIGNHTYSHLNGWQTPVQPYIDDYERTAGFVNSELFRPPYGRIKLSQAEHILQKSKIIMWDVLSYDFDRNLKPETVFSNVINNARPGSIVVFHDSDKAFAHLHYALPRCLEFFKNEGYSFDVL